MKMRGSSSLRLSALLLSCLAAHCGPADPPPPTCGGVVEGDPECGDPDRDGVPEADDNCPGLRNPPGPGGRQYDADGDGIGDACDEDSGCEPGPMWVLSSEMQDDGMHVVLAFNANPDYLVSGREGIFCAEVCGLAWEGPHAEPTPIVARDDDGDGWMEVDTVLPSFTVFVLGYRPLSSSEDEDGNLVCGDHYYQDPCAEGNWAQPYGDRSSLAGMCPTDMGYIYYGHTPWGYEDGGSLRIELSGDGGGTLLPAGNQQSHIGGD
ncbi:MAG: hypothetical protein ABIJ46_02880 [bacterium]